MPGALQRAAEHDGRAAAEDPADQVAHPFGLGDAVGDQREVGATGVPAVDAPLGGTVAHQQDHQRERSIGIGHGSEGYVVGVPTKRPPVIMWFRRDLRLGGQPGAVRCRGRWTRRAAVRRRSGVRPRRRRSSGVPARRPALPARGDGRGARRAPWRSGRRRRRAGRRGRGGDRARRPGLRPVRAPAGRRGDRAAAARRACARGHRVAVRRRTGSGAQGRRLAVPGVHPVRQGVGRARRASPRRTSPTWTGTGRRRCDPTSCRSRRPATPSCRRSARRLRGTAGTTSSTGRWRATPPTATVPTCPGRAGCRPTCAGASCTRANCSTDLDAHRGPGTERFASELAWREFYADVLLRHPESAWHNLERDDGRDAGRHRRRGASAVRSLGQRHHRLSRSSTPGCASCRLPAGCTTACAWSRPASSSRTSTCRGGGVRGTSCVTSSTATWRRTTTAGNGQRAPAPMPRRTSGCSTRRRSRSGSTRTATTSGGGSPSWPGPMSTASTPLAGPAAAPTRPPMVDHRAERVEALRRYALTRRTASDPTIGRGVAAGR